MADRALAGHNHAGFGTTQLDRKYLQRVFTASPVSRTIPIFLILASQLERVLPPFAIMLLLPFSLVGVSSRCRSPTILSTLLSTLCR